MEQSIQEHKFTLVARKIISDSMFNVAAFTLLLTIRKISLKNANLLRKLTPISTAILQYEKSKNIQSTLFYTQRFTAYLFLASIISGSCQYYDANALGTSLKGSACGLCFGFVKTGVLVGIGGGLIYFYCEEQLKEFL